MDHRIRQFWFSTRLKSKTWFFTFLNMYVSLIERAKILNLQLSPLKFRYFAGQNGPKGGIPWKRIVTFFKYKNEKHEQSELKK